MYDIVIVGGGISGLSFANYSVKHGYKTLLLEKNNKCGGSIDTRQTPDKFWIEMGGHTCYNSYGYLLDILEEYDLKKNIKKRQKRPYKILINGELKSILSQLSIFELVWNIPKLFFISKKGYTIKEYYSKILGIRNYKNLFSSLFNAVSCQKADDIDAKVLFKKRTKRKDVLRHYTFTNGLTTFVEALINNKGLEVITNKNVWKIEYEKKLYHIYTEEKKKFTSKYLVMATNPHIVAMILKKTYPVISKVLSNIKISTTESLGIVVKKEYLSISHIAGVIFKDNDVFSLVSRDVIPDENYRGFTFHFIPNKLSDEEKINKVCAILGITSDRIAYKFEKKNVIPTLGVENDKIVKKMGDELKKEGLFITGNYFQGFSIEDCVERSFNEFQRLKNTEGKKI